VPRRVGLERWDHRVAGISPDDIERVKDRLAQALEQQPAPAGGIDWKTVLRFVVDRYANRLDVVQYLLNITLDDTPVLLDRARKVQRQLRTTLAPYIILAELPRNGSVDVDGTNSWAARVFQRCATTHTSSIAAHGTTLTPSERLLLQAVRETTHEICRVTTRTWASGFIAGIDPLYPADTRPEVDRIRTLVGEWKEDMTKLISWLDWSVWVKCQPACGVEVKNQRRRTFDCEPTNLLNCVGDVLLAYLAVWIFPKLGQCCPVARPQRRRMEETAAQVHQTARAVWLLEKCVSVGEGSI
jgi:hypothetical protein